MKLSILLVLASTSICACGMQHMGRLDGADGATADGSVDDRVLVIIDGDPDAADPDAVADSAPDADPDASDAGSDSGTEVGPDAGTDSGQDAGQDSGADTAPDVTPSCSGGETWCGSNCVMQSFAPTSCGDCSQRACGSEQTCQRSPQNSPTCCSVVLTLTDGSVGHCPAGACDGGRCYSGVAGFNIVNWYCCPATP